MVHLEKLYVLFLIRVTVPVLFHRGRGCLFVKEVDVKKEGPVKDGRNFLFIKYQIFHLPFPRQEEYPPVFSSFFGRWKMEEVLPR
jgi:hypothetical protein